MWTNNETETHVEIMYSSYILLLISHFMPWRNWQSRQKATKATKATGFKDFAAQIESSPAVSHLQAKA